MVVVLHSFFFFKQKTAYDMRISDWSSDVCSSDLFVPLLDSACHAHHAAHRLRCLRAGAALQRRLARQQLRRLDGAQDLARHVGLRPLRRHLLRGLPTGRSEEHTSELQSLMRISYAVFCLKKKNQTQK